MRVAILTSIDSSGIRDAVSAIAREPGVQIAGILFDVETPSFTRRLRNLRNNLRREGLSYVGYRACESIAAALEDLAVRMVAATDVDELLRRAFPDESFSLQALADRLGVPLIRVTNLNSSVAAERLRALNTDLGVVIGTRILKPSTFTIPRLGCLNLHKGKVPEYRGLPPGFWELYERADSAGVTVHFIDRGLDTGDIVATSTVPIHHCETPVSLERKLDAAGAELIARAVGAVAAGTATRVPQPIADRPARTAPTRAQREELAQRCGTKAYTEPTAFRIAKHLWCLLLYFGGIVPAVRRWRRDSRGCVLLYHRVNDYSVDPLTTSRRRFAEHLVLLKRHYHVRSTSWLVERVRNGQRIPPTTVVIHFDDTYEDVARIAAPILEAAGLPAASFVSTGFIGSDRAFAHDERDSPWQFRNMTAAQIAALPSRGIEVGAHTVNHVNMGRVAAEHGRRELGDGKSSLEGLVGKPVRMFSFPFGRAEHFSEDGIQWARDAGYEAIFSAHGGFAGRHTSAWNIPRNGSCDAYSPLYLSLEIEGLGLAQLRARLTRPAQVLWRKRASSASAV